MDLDLDLSDYALEDGIENKTHHQGHNNLPELPFCNTSDSEQVQQVCVFYNWTREHLDVYDDHITINNSVSILRTDYFTSKLDVLDDFAGFCPRWILP